MLLISKSTVFLLVIFLSTSVCSAAVTNTWSGASGIDWFDAGNWSAGIPAAGHHVVITNVSNSPLLTNSTAILASFVITSNTLTFTNWTTTLTASNVTIKSGGEIALPPAFTESQMSNRVHIVCTNFGIEVGGKIDADEKGYDVEQGPGKGVYNNGGPGGGYGGRGGRSGDGAGGSTYGATNAPVDPGSGGGEYTPSYPAGRGGGAVRIDANGGVTINGTITANGGVGDYASGGGSGGGIYITCNTFGGSTNGLLSANGGNGGTWNSRPGGGGGGRIAVQYQSLAGTHSVRFSTSRGTISQAGELGTVYLADTAYLSDTLKDELFMNVLLCIPGFTNWSVNNLTMSNCVVTFGEEGFQLNVTNNVSIVGGGGLGLLANSRLDCGGNITLGSGSSLELSTNSTLNCGESMTLDGGMLSLGGLGQGPKTVMDVGGNLIMTNGSSMYVYSGVTNTITTNGALVTVTGNVSLAMNSWIYPYSNPTNGGSVLFRINNLVISTNAGFDGDEKGYAAATGPGEGSTSGSYGGGGGYGGKGGQSSTGVEGGSTYGLTNAPVAPGSGGGVSAYGGNGGGSVRIEAAGGVTINGTITVIGGSSTVGGSAGGGGSGGGIFITCETFDGSTNGILCAKGGNGGPSGGGGGGGGRIAIGIGLSEEARNKLIAGEEVDRLYTYYHHAAYAGTISVTNGTGYEYGDAGTAIFMTTNYCLTITGNPANYDSPSPHAYGTHPYMADNTEITNSVTSPVDQASGLRHSCFGWNLNDADGTPVSNAASLQAVFQLTTNLVLTWNWTNEYELTVSSGNTNRGTVNTNVNGWYTNGVEVPGISATGTNEYEFLQWTGDVPSGQETNNPLTVTMDQARTIQAQFYSLSGETKTWTGSGNWESATNWSPGGMPGPYDEIIIESGSVILSESREMGTLIVSNNAILTFTNWDTTLTASNVTIQNEGKITLPGAFTESQMSNRVHIVCSNFMIEVGGKIDVDERGYARDNGPGKGVGGSWAGGAGYGGRGESLGLAGGPTYGSTNAPIAPGSGGGSFSSGGGDGGGAVRIEASSSITINGTITANGGEGAYASGSGSGGGIFITCKTFGGSTNGLLSVNGREGDYAASGGGRIAVIYDEDAQAGQPKPGVRFSTGSGGGADIGTVYFPDRVFLSATLKDELFMGVLLIVPGFTNWALDSLTMSNCVVTFVEEGFQLTVTNDVLFGSGGGLTLLTNSVVSCGNMTLSDGGSLCVYSGGTTNSTISCGGNMTLTNGGSLYVYSGVTNGLGVDHGALVSVTGDVEISSSSWIYPYSHPTDGGSVLFRFNNLVILTNAGFNADAKGYGGRQGGDGYGPGAGKGYYGSGAGYGGRGGDSDYEVGGSTYGSTNAPVAPGSGGGQGGSGSPGGDGGGAVRIEAAAVTVNGTIRADGGDGPQYGGGGSGGAVFIICDTFDGSNSILRVEGGNGTDGGGGAGGGRIAVWYGVPEDRWAGIRTGTDMRRVSIASEYSGFSGLISVTNGVGIYNPPSEKAADSGTIVFLTVTPPSGTVFMCQ